MRSRVSVSGPGRYHLAMSFERLVESRIKDAMDAGQFSNLAGEGKPLRKNDEDELAGDNWMGFHVLRNANMLPAWLELAKEIEVDLQALQKIDDRHAIVAENIRERGANPSRLLALSAIRHEYEVLARRIRAKQDQFNIDAPAIIVERPGIWVERRLEKLDARIEGVARQG